MLLSLEAKAVGVGVHVHLWQQLQLGRGLPLHALRAHRIDAWQCTVPLREGWLKVPSASGLLCLDDEAASARLLPSRAQAAPTHRRAAA